MAKYKVVHHTNQFFAGAGDEEKTDYTPELREGVIGPSMGLKVVLGEDYEIVSTTICGDNYSEENLDATADITTEMVKKCESDVFVAGLAFNARRYGITCGTICKTVEEHLGIPVITGMYIENSGADMSRKDLTIVDTSSSAAGMPKVLPVMSALIKKMAVGEKILEPKEEGYTEGGVRVNYSVEKRGFECALEVLVKKLKGEEYGVDPPMLKFDRVAPAEPVKDIKYVKIAVATSGGIVPTDNPDHIEFPNAIKWGKYDIIGMDRLSADEFTAIHGGYDRQFAMANPNVVVPLDALRESEKADEFGELVDYFCTIAGTGTATASAAELGSEIGQMFIDKHMDVVILVSTRGICTRCGATAIKGIEKYGVPVAHMTTVVPISLTVGANRTIPSIGIPHPLGDPPQDEKDSYKLCLSMVRRALETLQTPVDDQTVFEK